MAGRQRYLAVALLLLASFAAASPPLPLKKSHFCAAATIFPWQRSPLTRQRDLEHACEAAATRRSAPRAPPLVRLRGGGGGGDDEDDFLEVEFKMEAEETARVILRVRVRPLTRIPTALEAFLHIKDIHLSCPQ